MKVIQEAMMTRLFGRTSPSGAARCAVRALVLAVAIALAGLVTVASPSLAAVSPLQPRDPGMVTADRLPTAQINGVAWDTEIAGSTVYVGGNFSQARPAGAAPGTNETPRSNLMAFNLANGEMTSWNPNANGQVLVIAKSPDGSRIYVGGDFTSIGGQSRSRIAAFNTSNGNLIGNFAPPVGYTVRAIVATNSTVYVGGSFNGVGQQTRNNLAAFNASNGALLSWAPSVERQVNGLGISADGNFVIAGGAFETVNGVTRRGLAKIDAVSGAVETWPVDISNAGADSGITSIHVAGEAVYGTGYHFGAGGNQEGPWKINVSTGELLWVADCHGDTYDSYPGDVATYTVGHSHYCGNVSRGFPQYADWRFQHNMAWSQEATGTNIREVHGYPNWDGRPSPSIKHWFPTMGIGSITGQSQAGWTVEGNGQYLVVGGEFPTVNGSAQQGLTRFATRPTAPGSRGPAFLGNQLVPTLQPMATDAVKVSWMGGYDQDDRSLTYRVSRSPGGIVKTFEADSNWWNVPGLHYVDKGLTPGATYTYSIRVSDSTGNTVFGSNRSVTLPETFSRNDYSAAVLADEPSIYWPLNDPVGSTTIADHAGGVHGVPGSAVTSGVTNSAVVDDTAVSVNNNNNGRIYAEASQSAPTDYSAEVWFRTSTASGRLLGFGDLQVGNSGHRDRQIYLTNSGRVHFGVRSDGTKVINSPSAYNNNQWHQAVATLSGTSMRLYVDGRLVAERDDVTNPEEYVGHWRLGGDSQSGWPSAGNANFTGSMDEMSIYPYALTPEQVNAHYVASGRASQLPTDGYGLSVDSKLPFLYWRLDETTGTNVSDASINARPGTYRNGHTKGETGIPGTDPGTSVSFNGTNGFVSANSAATAPAVFSTEVWFKTTTTQGGKLIGYGNNQTGLSTNNQFDRHIYMRNNGQLVFGVRQSNTNHLAETTASYNDGEWHQAVSTFGSDGMKLYVDGELAASNNQTSAQSYSGRWKVGGDATWEGVTPYFSGLIDEVSVHTRQLTPAEVQAHYTLGSLVVPNEAPTAAFTHESNELQTTFDASESSDPDGTIVEYNWDFGDGTTGSGVNPVHLFPGTGQYEVTLTVVDNRGREVAVTKTVSVTAPPPNEAPSAAFAFEVSDLTASFDASGSADADGSIVSYSWDFGDGSAGSGVTPVHAYAEGGSYDVKLTVTDDDAATDDVTHTVTVTAPPPNQAPVAAFDVDVTHLQVAVDASESADSDGEIVAYNWDFGDGNSGSGLNATHTYAAEGDYTIALTVTDDDGANHTVTRNVTVQAPPANQAPNAHFTATAVGLTVNADASASTDTDGTIDSYEWDFGGGFEAGSVTAAHTYSESGTHAVRLRVTDDDGATDVYTESVTVTAPPANEAPEAGFDVTTAGLTATLTSTSTDSDGEIESWEWDLGDGNTADTPNVVHTYAAAGTYQVKLKVTDDDGASDTMTVPVVVESPPPANEAPVAGFTASASDLTVAFDGSSSNDSDGSIVSYTWDFGDGTFGSGVSPSHAYASAGSYQVKLTVVDDDGASDEVTKTIEVSTPGPVTFALDTFSRTVNNAWGTADLGGAWTSGNTASLFKVSDGVGSIRMPNAGSGPSMSLSGVSARDVDARVDIAFDKPATGNGIYGSVMVRRNGTSDYRLTVRPLAGSTNLILARSVNGVETTLANTTLPWVYQPGDVVRMRLVADGNGPTSLRGKAWRVGDAEPSAWQLSATDSTTALQVAGGVTLYTYLSGSATNAPVVALVDNVSVTGVGAAPANQLPVAAFSTQVSGLEVSVDGSASADSDGSIASYSWNWGDGSPAGSGATATHTYATPGQKTITLTVTDNQGASHEVSHQVTATATDPDPEPGEDMIAADSFGRTVTAGLGAADVGGNWTTSSSTNNLWVSDGVGTLRMPNPGSGPKVFLNAVSAADVDTTLTVSLDKKPTGGDTYVILGARESGGSGYGLKVRFQPSSTMLILTRTVAGAESNVANATLPAGETYQEGDVFRVRFAVAGTGPTTLQGKIWRIGASEPTSWQVSGTDTTAGLQAPGGISLRPYLSGSAANAPVLARIDDLAVVEAG